MTIFEINSVLAAASVVACYNRADGQRRFPFLDRFVDEP